MRFIERLALHAQQHGSHAAVLAEHTSLDYAQLHTKVRLAAGLLDARGVGPSDVVGLSLADEVQHLIASLALMAVGAGQVTLPSHDRPPLRAEIAARLRVGRVLADQADDGLPALPVLAWPLDAQGVEPLARQPGPAGPATLYLKTSGTTGRTNIVPFTEVQIGAQAERHADYAQERLLRLASIEYNNSKRHRLYCVWAGGTNVFRPTRELDVVDFVLRHRVTCLDISRMHAADLVQTRQAHLLGGVKLRTGGSAVPAGIRRAIEHQVTRQLYVRYAATECGAIAMALPGSHDDEETSGAALPGVHVEVVDPQGRVCPSGTPGEVRLRAAGMADGYYDAPEQTARRFRDGWFYPGDMACLRADGQIRVLGRSDDMIVMNGLNIFPGEIEQVLERHPAVAAAAALPIASAVHGQIPVAAVELRPGADISADELRRHARERLALRAPRKVLVLPSLPRNSQGKIVRRELVAAFGPAGSKP